MAVSTSRHHAHAHRIRVADSRRLILPGTKPTGVDSREEQAFHDEMGSIA
jgi:hypothetical protein